MDKFIDACIDRSRAVVLILLLILIAGFNAYLSVPKEKEPDIQIPIIYTSITHEGISPEDAERLLIRPMEKELRSIENVKQMTSYASEGRASVTLEFIAGFDSSKALNDVREKVDIAKVDLPDDTDEPEVNEVNLSLFPVVNVIMTGDVPERTLFSIAKKMRDKIEELSNVLKVEIAGDREDAVEIIIDPLTIESYGLTLETMNRVSEGFNKLVASGTLDNSNGRFSIKVPGLLENLNDILSLPIAVSGDAIITVGDIAEIKKTFKDTTGYARVNGKPAVVLEVSKRTGTNIIQTIDAVKEVVTDQQQYLPDSISISYSQDTSQKILDMLSDLENNIILAVVMVMVIILIAVGFRSATLVTVAIPGAFLIGVLIIAFMGLTMNIVVLFSLILSVGMLVDSAIIVCEMADRKMLDGTSYKEAYAIAAKYMKWPIIASTATTLVVFMPLLFWPGIIGQFMQYLPITLIATLSGSLIMAIIFIPTLGTMLATKRNPNDKNTEFIKISESGDLDKLTGFSGNYYFTLKHTLNHAGKFAFVIFAILCIVYVYYAKFGTGVEFFPDIEPENSQVKIRARGNLSVQEKDKILKEVESKILDMNDEIRIFYSKSDNLGQGGGMQQVSEDTIGVITTEFTDWKKRRKASQINEEIKDRLKNIKGIIVEIQDEKSGPKKAKPIELEIGSQFPELLEPTVVKILDNMSKVEGLVDIEDSRPIPEIEWKMEMDRKQAAKFHSDLNIIGSFIKLVTNGIRVTSYRPDYSDDEVDILVRFPKDKRNLATLDNLKVNTEFGSVPASNFVTRTARQKVGTITRADGMRVLTIKAGVKEGVLANDIVKQLTDIMKDLNIDQRVNVKFKGDDESQKEASEFLKSAFILALFFMALILVTQFNSIYYMIIIMSAVFLSTVGVLLGLLITGQPFGIVMCGVGVISLSGIVVNNNIIFIDTYQKLKNEGQDTKEALLRTGLQRLRPILLTAGTTVLGLIPMVVGMSINFSDMDITFGAPSSQWWKQLSTSIAGGLTFATILTLFFTPCLILIGDSMFAFFARLKNKVLAWNTY